MALLPDFVRHDDGLSSSDGLLFAAMTHLAGIATTPQRALVDLSAGAFSFWVAMHTIDVSLPIAALSAACKATRSTGARHLAELRRCGYLAEEEGNRVLVRVMDVRGRNAFVKI